MGGCCNNCDTGRHQSRVFSTLGNGAALKRKNSGDLIEVLKVETEDVHVNKKMVKDNSRQFIALLLMISFLKAEERKKTMHILLNSPSLLSSHLWYLPSISSMLPLRRFPVVLPPPPFSLPCLTTFHIAGYDIGLMSDIVWI
ncbi:hypothetical protein TIFTF001_017271 [Ficus carica]|uniref:Uncharacterized protein n=1 Tax=Ficus carica TaxID=3494 RepID=A0AA88DAK3_FICCA|nr:hypothetical protein TIFTF001_017271 [Ficus carica]